MSDLRELEAAVCWKLRIAKVLPRLLQGVVESGKGHEEYPEVSTDPVAFDLVVEKLGERGWVFHVDSDVNGGHGDLSLLPGHLPSAAFISNRQGSDTDWVAGATWQEAVCRAVLEMED